MAEEYDLQGNPITSGDDGGASGGQQGAQEFDLQGNPVGGQERQHRQRQRQPQRQQPRQGRQVEGGYTVGGDPFAGQRGVTPPSEQPVTPQRGGTAARAGGQQRQPAANQGSVYTDVPYSAARGLARTGTAIPQAAGIAQGYLTGQDPRETELYQAGTEAQQYVEESLPLRQPEQGDRFFWSQELPNAVGQMLGYLAPVPGARVAGGVARGVTGSARAGRAISKTGEVAGGASLGAATMASEGFQDALREGASISEAMEASGLNALLGPTEMVPLGRALDRLDKGTGGKLRRTLTSAAKFGTEEAIQETGTTIAQNLIASDIVEYDRDRGTFEYAQEAGEVGFGAGALMGALAGMVGGRRLSEESGVPLKDREDEDAGGAQEGLRYEQPPTMDVGGDLEGALGQSMQGRQAEAQQPAAASRGGPTAAEAGATPGVAPASPAGTGTPDDPLRPMTDEAIKQYEQRINQLPTDGQAEAGNYAKLHGSFQGLDIAIENARGQKRRGTDPSGRQWETELPANYGYIKGTKGPDGDAVDTFVGPNASMDRAYVIDQRDPDSKQFDEPKVMLGFDSQQEAVDTYKRAFDDRADERIQAVTPTSISGVRNVLDQNDRTVNEPFSDLFESTPISDAEIAEAAQRRNLTGDLEAAITDEVSFDEAQQQVPEAFNAIEQEVLEQGRPQQAEQAKRRTYEMARDNQLSAAMEARRGRGDQGAAGGGATAAGIGGRGTQQAELEQPDAGTVERTPTPEQTLELSQRNMARQQGRDIQQFDPDQYLQGQQATQQRQGLPTRTDYGDRLQDANMQVPQRSPDQVDPQSPYSTLRFDDQGVQEQSFATAGEAVQAAARLPRDAEFQVRNMATGEVVAEPSLNQTSKMRIYRPSTDQGGQPQYSATPSGGTRGTAEDDGQPSRARDQGDAGEAGRRDRAGGLQGDGAPDEQGRITEPPVNEDGTVTLHHWSRAEGLEQLDPRQHGEGLPGQEKRRKRNYSDLWVDRTYFGIGVDQPGGYTKERGLGDVKYTTRVDASRMYPLQRDPDGLLAEAKAEYGGDRNAVITAYERKIADAGYAGYWVNYGGEMGVVGVSFEPMPVERDTGIMYSATPSAGQEGANEIVLPDDVVNTRRVVQEMTDRDVALDAEGRVIRPEPRKAQARLDRELKRRKKEQRPGRPKNERMVFEDDAGAYVATSPTFDDWIARTESQLDDNQIAEDARWYQDIRQVFQRYFGQDWQAYMQAWLIANVQASPSSAMENALLAREQITTGLTTPDAGLNAGAVRTLFQGGIPSQGIGQKLYDFIDSALLRRTRTIMNDDPRGGEPATMDRWAMRDAGYTDGGAINYVLQRFGPEAAQNLGQDFGASPSETQYETAANWYRDLTDYLNQIGWKGRNDWRPLEIQAVGWHAMSQLYGRRGGSSAQAILDQFRRLSFELDPGAGAPYAERYPELSGLRFGDKKKVTERVLGKAVEIAEQETGVRQGQTVFGSGGWGWDPVNPAAQYQTFSSKFSARAFADIVGYLAQQTEMYISTPQPDGDQLAIDLIEADGSGNMADDLHVEHVWQSIKETDARLAQGFHPIIVDGKPGMRIILGDDTKALRGQLDELKDAASAAAWQVGSVIDTATTRMDVEVRSNDWQADPAGRGYRSRLEEALGPGVSRRLDDQHRPELERELEAALRDVGARQYSATPSRGRVRAEAEREGGGLSEEAAAREQAEDQGRANVGGSFGSGLGYRDFFAEAAAGQHAPAKLDEQGYQRLIDLTPIERFVNEYQRHRGNFDDHIMTSIPAFGDIQPNVGNAIVQALPEGGNMLDIGASEGALIKAISRQSNGKIKTVGVDPNPQMAREQDEISKVRGMEYRMEAFGTAEEAGTFAWQEDDGTPIYFYDPGETRFDVVHEAMVFQFISNERESQLRRAKEVMKDDGMLIVEEKHVPDEGAKETWEKNEKQKDRFKEQYYTEEQLQKKKQQVLEGDTEAKTRDQIAREEEGVMGMHDLMVPSAEMERILSNEFRHVVQFWDSGNFKGYVATNDRTKLDQFLGNLLDTNTDYSTVTTPRVVQEAEGPAFTTTPAFGKRRLKSRQRIQEIADRITGGRAQIDFKPKIIAQNGSVRDSGGEVGQAAGGYVIPDQWLIGLAMEDSRFDPRNEVGHEAFHLLEHYGLFTPEEMSALQRNEPFLREEAAKEFRLPANSKLIRELASHEVRAIAFARYRRLKEEGQPRAGYLPAIRRAFNKVLEFMRQVRNAMRGLGFRTVNSVFEDVRTGVLARRGSVDIESSFTGPELYSDRGTAPAFFSKLRVGMENVDADAMKGNGWLQQIEKLKKQGVKDEELEWSGLPEWLEENKGTKLSKQQVLDFIDANTIEIGEVQYSEDYAGPDPDEEYEPDIIRRGEYTEEGEPDEEGIAPAPVKVHELEDRETGETYTVQVDEDAGNVTAMRADGTPVPVPGEMNRQDIQDGTDAVVTDLTARHGRWPDNLGALVEQAENAGIWKSKQVARQASQIARSTSVQNDPNSGDVDRLVAMFRGNTDDRAWVERLYEMQEAEEQRAAEVVQGRPEYGRYATPGGENYREVLLTAPQLDDTYRSEHWEVDNVLAHVRMQDFENADGEQVLLVDEIQSDWHQQGREKGYKPSGQELQRQRVEAEAQYEEMLTENLRRIEESENGAAWVQWIKDMVYKMPPEAAQTLGDPDTRIGLAQAAAEVYMDADVFRSRQTSPYRRGELDPPPGYTGVDPTEGVAGRRRAQWASERLRLSVIGRERMNATERARDNMQRLKEGRPGGTPQAPFKRTWPELALKRVLREAAEQGYDRVAWTTGATQADRYNLRRHVKTVRFDRTRGPEGGGVLDAFDKETGQRILSEHLNSIDDAEQYIGRELTQKLVEKDNAGEDLELSGIDLETGGEGMKTFYDKMLPNFAKKYVKKWGAKVEPSEIETSEQAPTYEGPEFSSGKELFEYLEKQQPGDQLGPEETRVISTVGERLRLGRSFKQAMETQAAGSLEARTNVARMVGGRLEQKPIKAKVWSVPITTDMREAVLNQGQPLYSATKTIKEDAPVSRSVADRVIGEPGTNPLLQSMKEVFRSDATWPGKFRLAFNHLRERFRVNALQGAFDQYYALYDREKRARGQVDFKRSGWVAALMTNDIGSVMANVIGEKYGGEWQGGALKYNRKEGAFQLDTDAKPMFAILEPLARAGRLKQWQLWTVAKRTKRLIQEDQAYNAANPDKKPRDRDALMAEIARQEGKDRMQLIDEIIAEGNKHPEFQKALDEWNDLNSRILDMAQEAGIVNKEQREVWEQQDYVPFYRVVQELGDDTITGPSQRAGIVNQDAQIKALRGGEAPVNDIVENMALNLTHLVQSSMKNVAAQKAVPVLQATGDIEKVPYKAQPQHVSNAEAKKALQNAGVDVGEMTEEQMQRYFSVFQMVPPRGRDVFHVMVDGKPQFYRVNDPLLFSALTSMGVDRPQGWMRVLSAPKKLLTEFVTADPAFAIANGMRDSIQTWLITGEKFTPIYDSVKGMNRAWKRDASMRAIMAGGGGGGGFYSFASQDVRKQIEQHDPRTVIDSPTKAITLMKRLYRGYDRLLNTTEMANRISVYDQVKARGGSEAEAIFQAKDVMNFTMRGDWSIVRALVHMVPFMNARLQGLYRLGRGAKDNPRKFFLRGSLLTGVTMALWALNYDDERYQNLPEFEKDTYYHLFMDNIFGKEAVEAMGLPDWMRHIRIPKPFEVGAIFSTMPERAANTMLGTDTGEIFAERMRHMMMSTFSLNPIPQAALPIIEQWANKSFFMDTHIVSPYSQDLPPEMQYEADTSETARAVGEAISFSPQRVEHLVRGYLGSVGMYMLDASDMAMRGVGAYEEAPVTRPDEMPVISRFFRGEPKKYTKWLGEFYDTKREIDGIYNGIQQARERGNYEAAKRLRKENAELLRMRGRFQSIQQQLRRINEQMRRTHFSGMDPKDKRERLDNLYEQRNRTVAQIERMLRDVVVQDGEVRSVGGDEGGGPAGWLNVISDAFAKGETDRAQMAYDRAETQGVQIDVSEAARRSGQDATARILDNAPAGMAQRIEQNQEQ